MSREYALYTPIGPVQINETGTNAYSVGGTQIGETTATDGPNVQGFLANVGSMMDR